MIAVITMVVVVITGQVGCFCNSSCFSFSLVSKPVPTSGVEMSSVAAVITFSDVWVSELQLLAR